MKRLVLTIAVLFSIAAKAQIGLGMTNREVRTKIVIPSDTVDSTYYPEDSTYALEVTSDNDLFLKIYQFDQQGICYAYGVFPLVQDACDSFELGCNKKYIKAGKDHWTFKMNGRQVGVEKLYMDEIKEHIYIFRFTTK